MSERFIVTPPTDADVRALEESTRTPEFRAWASEWVRLTREHESPDVSEEP